MTNTTARRGLIAGAALALVLGIGVTSVAAQPAQIAGTAVVAAGASVAEVPAVRPVVPVTPGYGSGGTSPGYGYGNGNGNSDGNGYGNSDGNGYGNGYGSASGGTGTAATGTATTAQQVGVVDIDTVLSYQGAEAAGTGLVLTSSGEILTNNHVVEGSTSIVVTIVSSGEQYKATVVGTDATDDVAVLQLTGASNLATANLADSSAVSVGDAVTGVGNAGGVGGTPSASPGTVTATGQQITTQAEGSAAAETLTGLIETNADIQAGDSGGPLFNAADQVVGIDTAAQSGGIGAAGYAIPISTATGIAQQIEAGTASQNIVIGYPAFLGVQVAPAQSRYTRTSTSGALISGVISGAPAQAAGLTAGDTITAIDGTAITDASALSATLAGDTPGQNVTVTWVSAGGASQSAAVTLASGPAA